jgi:triosephosphate isomerase
MADKKYLIGNWKANPASEEEAVHLASDIESSLEGLVNSEIVICPPFLYAVSVRSALRNSKLGVQNISAFTTGAFTGEIAGSQLADLHVAYAIIGHSERRKNNRETDRDVYAKMKACLINDIIPILCIGAGLEAGDDEARIRSVLRKEFMHATDGVYIPKLLVAYEPAWAIGTGLSATPQHVDAISDFIRSVSSSDHIAETVVLYGGSVHAGNAADFRNIDGFLVGGASLDPREFAAIAKSLIANEA